MIFRLSAGIFFIACASFPAPGTSEALAATASRYSITPLNAGGETFGSGLAINAQGDVAGYGEILGVTGISAWVWRGGEGAPLPRPAWMNFGETYAFDISDTGGIVGSADGATLWTPGGAVWIGFPVPAGGYSTPRGISADGRFIVGGSDVLDQTRSVLTGSGYMWEEGVVREISYPGADRTTLMSVNSSGKAAGAWWKDGTAGMFVYEQGQFRDLSAGSVSIFDIAAMTVTEAGLIVGTMRVDDRYSGPWVAFTSDGDAATPLTVPVGADSIMAHGANASAEIVGEYFPTAPLPASGTAQLATTRAALWADGTVFDLMELSDAGALGWTVLARASDINDAGQITGQGMLDGRWTAFVMAPVPVPEPGTVTLWACGGCAVIWRVAARRGRSGHERGCRRRPGVLHVLRRSFDSGPR